MVARMEFVQSKSVIRTLPCELTIEERLALGTRLAETASRLATEEQIQEQQKTEMKARKSAIESDRARLSGLISSGFENRDIECEMVFDLSRLMLQVIRKDTGSVFETRRMSEVEIRDHQPKLSFEESSASNGPASVLAFDREKSDEDLAAIEQVLAAEADGVEEDEVTDEQLEAVDATHDAEDAEDEDSDDEPDKAE